MRSVPSKAFRRQCLALVLVALSWALPNRTYGDAYPLQDLKNITDTLKPNVLIVLESAESMQGLPGENQARYNTVGVDCENGNRSCRLVGQRGRWAFSGMGSRGMYFGTAPTTCTNTYTDTVTGIQTFANTQTWINPTATVTNSNTITMSETVTNTSTAYGTETFTTNGTDTLTGYATSTHTETSTGTHTVTTTGTHTETTTGTHTETTTGTHTVTTTGTHTETTTGTHTVTTTGTHTVTTTGTHTETTTGTHTVTTTGTHTETTTGTHTETTTGTHTITVPGTMTLMGTSIVTLTDVGASVNWSGTITGTLTSAYVAFSATASTVSTGTATLDVNNWWLSAVKTSTVTVTNGTTGETSTATMSFAPGGTLTGTQNVTATRTNNAWGSGSSWTVPGSASKLMTSTASFNNWGAVSCTFHDTVTAQATTTEQDTVTGWDTTTAQDTMTVQNTTTTQDTTTAQNTTTASNTTTAQDTATAQNTTTVQDTATFPDTTTAQDTITAWDTTTLSNTITKSNTVTNSSTALGTGTLSEYGTDTFTSTGNAIDTQTFEDTQVYTATGTETNGACAFPGAPDPGDCISSGSESTNRGYCNWSTYAASSTSTNTATLPTAYVSCSSEEPCSGRTKGDFCRYISELDYSGREHGEVCIGASTSTITSTATSTAWGSCKRGLGTQNTDCGYSSGSDACTGNLGGDFCAEGKPAKMCAESGIWCASTADCLTHRCSNNRELCINDEDCPIGGTCVYESTPPEACVPATSRMMIVKRALRRAVSDYADQVSFGFMTSYQGRGIPGTGTDASTKIFPYVKTVDGSGKLTSDIRLLTRGELEKGTHTTSGQSCFDPVNGPRTPCEIDYGAGGAINPTTLPQNKVTYYKTTVNGGDSVWSIRRNDGSSKYDMMPGTWSSSSCNLLCSFSGRTGVYEGSHYYLTYTKGTPIANGQGSMANPDYFDTYRGKAYWDGGILYNAIDAERSDFINDGIYGRAAYTPVNLSSPSPYSVITKSIVTVSGTSTGTSTSTVLMPDVSKEASVAPPWAGASAGQLCTPSSGAIWNHQVVPMLNATSFAGPGVSPAMPVDRTKKALMIAARLDKASFGGVAAMGSVAPIGCALDNDGSTSSYLSASRYMAEVRTSDAQANDEPPGVPRTPCWSNGIVLVVDGVSDGPGDMGVSADCASSACAYSSSNTTLTGCQCDAITKAYGLAHPSTGVPPIQTHVVVNAPARWSARYPYTYAFLWNLAVAGSPGFDGMPAFGTSETELYEAIAQKIALAAHRLPSYSTTEPVPGANTQDPATQIVTTSSYLYAAANSYPSWKGTVRAYDTTSGVQLLWDAATVAANGHPENWTKRRIYFGNVGGGITKITINPSDGTITNRDALYSAGLGASAAEAEKIMQWLLGKPELGNPSPLMGPISSSTPIVVGQAPDNGLMGAKQYSENTWHRPQLLYVGSDDGMLHAFFAHAGSKTLGTETYEGGEEAFAFIPKDMLPVIRKLYAQRGQPLSPDKGQHIFGLAGSPKVKDMCIGAGCATDATGAGWRTVLVMTEGPGGNKPFALDITNVVDATSGLNGLTTGTPGGLLWGAAFVGDSATWNADLGETISVPAFYLHSDVGGDENRVVFASGYPTSPTATGQGLFIVDANAATGAIVETRDVRLATAVASGFGGTFTDCSSPHPLQRRTVLADVALARDYSSQATAQWLKAAYTGDTWGNAFQYVPSSSTLGRLYSLGCGHPLHFAPAVVQLDRLPRSDPSSKSKIYLAQVTNSNLDPLTREWSATYPGSQLVVTKLDATTGVPTPDLTFNLTGQVTLNVCDDGSTGTNCICVQTTSGGTTVDFNGGAKSTGQGCVDAGGMNLPQGARPVGTPMAILRSDGLGFQVITGWYDASAIVNVCADGDANSFDKGTSYITVHEFRSNGAYYQIVGQTIENAVVTGGTFVGTGLFVDGIGVSPEMTPQSINLGEKFSTNQQMLTANAVERYTRTTWSERVE